MTQGGKIEKSHNLKPKTKRLKSKLDRHCKDPKRQKLKGQTI